MRVLHWWMERTSLTEQDELVCHLQTRPYVMNLRPYVKDKRVRQGHGLGIWPRTWGPLLGPCSGRQCGRRDPRVPNKMGYQTMEWDYWTYCSVILGCPNEPDTPGCDSCIHELWQSLTGCRCMCWCVSSWCKNSMAVGCGGGCRIWNCWMVRGGGSPLMMYNNSYCWHDGTVASSVGWWHYTMS